MAETYENHFGNITLNKIKKMYIKQCNLTLQEQTATIPLGHAANITSNLEEFVVGWLMIWVMVRGHLPFPLPGLSSTNKKTLEKD